MIAMNLLNLVQRGFVEKNIRPLKTKRKYNVFYHMKNFENSSMGLNCVITIPSYDNRTFRGMFCAFVQLCACGLSTVKQQMKLRRVYENIGGRLGNSSSSGCPSNISSQASGNPKLTLGKIKQLSAIEKHIYLIKYM